MFSSKLSIKHQRRMLSSWHTSGWRCFGHIAIDICIHEITPPQIVADPSSTICRHMQNFISRQNSVPHVYIINLAVEALFLLKLISITILILSKDKNAVSGDLMSCWQIIATIKKLAINVKLPRASAVLPCCADVVPLAIVGSCVKCPKSKENKQTKFYSINRGEIIYWYVISIHSDCDVWEFGVTTWNRSASKIFF